MLHILESSGSLHNISRITHLKCSTPGTSASTSPCVASLILKKIRVHFFGKRLKPEFSKIASGHLYSSESTLCQTQRPYLDGAFLEAHARLAGVNGQRNHLQHSSGQQNKNPSISYSHPRTVMLLLAALADSPLYHFYCYRMLFS